MPSQSKPPASAGAFTPFGVFAPVMDYMVDAAQRSVLFCDVMRQRGNQYREHLAETAPHVLDYEVELVIDGRTLERPVNYCLVRVVPPPGVEVDLARRPFVIVDPRAGHGPGIGGFKADSEIGVAFKAGHPCYFIGFLPDPMPGQTIEDIARAEAIFLEKVIASHPRADGKPCIVGNCQAGWAVMMLAAIRPELFGPIIIAGSPLSYWAGVHGKNPMRYSGGLLGGSWLTAFASDLGHGKFDGAWLVQNFENQNPANTLWSKQYNLYANIDTEAARYLGFERWWGGHVNLNAEEIQFIVDQLFIGNNLAAGNIQTSDGTAIDLRNIRSPIVVFCSKGDNITPPQQALGWILDLYANVDEIRSYGQTIVYTIHESVGHLGIFVSSGVAKKEHGEFSSNIDLIDTLPPGLYEAVFESKTEDTTNPDLAAGNWVMRCEARTLDDIRALGGNDAADERRFATAARISETNLALYRTFAQPMVRALVSSPVGGMDAAPASSAAAIRAVLQCESDDGAGRHLGRAGSREPKARGRRQSIRRDAGDHVPSGGRCARRVAGHERGAGRADIPFGLRLADAAGRLRRRPVRDTSVAEGREEPSTSRTAAGPHRRAQVAYPGGRVARSRDPRAALCRHDPGSDRRARVRGPAAHSPRARRHAVVDVQSARARPVQHAAPRHGRRARCNSIDASARCGDAAQGFRSHSRRAACAR